MSSDEQDAIASRISASLADGEAWKKRFVEKRDVLRRMAREALREDERGKTLPLGDLSSCKLFFLFRGGRESSGRLRQAREHHSAADER